MTKKEFLRALQYVQDLQVIAMDNIVTMSVSVVAGKELGYETVTAYLHLADGVKLVGFGERDEYMDAMKELHGLASELYRTL